MPSPQRSLVIANWKMNPDSAAEAKKIFLGIRAASKRSPHADVVVAAPFVYLSELQRLSPAGSVALAAQNVHYELRGAFTGEISMNMLTGVGVRHVIIGHSERRAAGETDEEVAKKVSLVLKAKCIPIICIGERERDSQGNYYLHIEGQIVRALSVVPENRYKHIVLAYEPIWAIGTGKHATAEDIIEMKLFITKIITKHFGRTAAGKVRILYGGSVNAENAEGLYATKVINGFLVGGASLDPVNFAKIISATT